jgi:hypothetical protein
MDMIVIYSDNRIDPIFFIASGMGLSRLYCGHFWPIVPAADDRWGWLWSNWRNEDWQGNPKYSEKTCPSATLSTTNPTWPEPGSNPGRRGGEPATNRLSYGAALKKYISHNTSTLCDKMRNLFNRNWWVFRLCPMSGILEKATFQSLDLLCLLIRANSTTGQSVSASNSVCHKPSSKPL